MNTGVGSILSFMGEVRRVDHLTNLVVGAIMPGWRSRSSSLLFKNESLQESYSSE